MNQLDTIVAQSTPKGRGGIHVIRVSGALVKEIIYRLFGTELKPREATFLPFCNQLGELIDEGLAIFFENPHSFTGEDVLELQGHGNPIVVDILIQHLIYLGARLARPGEFSERAFLNNKIDLTQAEAIADLIDAQSIQAAKLAMRSMQGDFSKAVNQISEELVTLRTHLEATIDFVDDEIDELQIQDIRTQLNDILNRIILLQHKAKQGSVLKEGIRIAIAGKPNVGKSSLLNRLSQNEVAIVTPIPGTTRDVLHNDILIHNIPIHIMDTAGIRESDDLIEQEGIRRAQEAIQHADIVLEVLDATCDTTIPMKTNMIVIRNKIDLLNEKSELIERDSYFVVSLSAKTGEGLDLLKNAIQLKVGMHDQTEGLYLARRRHLEALSQSCGYLKNAIQQTNLSATCDLIAEELRLAHQSLNEITGKFTTDDLLGRIFSTFCIGK